MTCNKLFHVDIVKKFDRHDAKFENKQKIVPYNPREEVRKVFALAKFSDYALYCIVSSDAASSRKERPITTTNSC